MTLDEIRQLIDTVVATGVAEIEVQRGENRVWIKRTPAVVTQEVVAPIATPAQAVMNAPFHVTPPTVTAGPIGQAAPPAAGSDASADPSLLPVKSPIVGTFYEASAPGAKPFISVGDAINPGKVLCIIESMKLMNEIEAEISGTIVKRLVENGQPVEYGEALYLVKPN
jgi:acetyl-CoA carboxylase biotin carboxyl carrier protein